MSSAALRLACCLLLSIFALQGLSRAVERLQGPLHYHAAPLQAHTEAAGAAAAAPARLAAGDPVTERERSRLQRAGHHHDPAPPARHRHGGDSHATAGHHHDRDVAAIHEVIHARATGPTPVPHSHAAPGRHRHDEARTDVVAVGGEAPADGTPAGRMGSEAFWLLAPEQPGLAAALDGVPLHARPVPGPATRSPGAPERPPRA